MKPICFAAVLLCSTAAAQTLIPVPSRDCYQTVYALDADTGAVRKFERYGQPGEPFGLWREYRPQLLGVKSWTVREIPVTQTAVRRSLGEWVWGCLERKESGAKIAWESTTFDLTRRGYNVLGRRGVIPARGTK